MYMYVQVQVHDYDNPPYILYTSNREMGVTTVHIVGRKKTVNPEKKTRTDYIFYYSIGFTIKIKNE